MDFATNYEVYDGCGLICGIVVEAGMEVLVKRDLGCLGIGISLIGKKS